MTESRRSFLPALRDEPGSGKSSLAAFLARNLGWRYYEHVVSSRTTAQDLLWSFDSMRRLARASTPGGAASLDDASYTEPGVMWWALDRESALRRGRAAVPGPPGASGAADDAPEEQFGTLNADRDPAHAVMLIDEIDKADPDVPNGLLVPLGSIEFLVTPDQAPGPGAAVRRRPAPPPDRDHDQRGARAAAGLPAPVRRTHAAAPRIGDPAGHRPSPPGPSRPQAGRRPRRAPPSTWTRSGSAAGCWSRSTTRRGA